MFCSLTSVWANALVIIFFQLITKNFLVSSKTSRMRWLVQIVSRWNGIEGSPLSAINDHMIAYIHHHSLSRHASKWQLLIVDLRLGVHLIWRIPSVTFISLVSGRARHWPPDNSTSSDNLLTARMSRLATCGPTELSYCRPGTIISWSCICESRPTFDWDSANELFSNFGVTGLLGRKEITAQ